MPFEARSRLPIQDPDYRYPSSRNPYWTKLQEFKGMIFSDHETELHRGNWRSQFAADPLDQKRKLHVEIGCKSVKDTSKGDCI